MPLSFRWVEDPIDILYSRYSGLLVAEATTVLWAFAGILLIMYALKYGRYGGIQWFILDYGIIMLIAANVLKYWITPCPILGGYTVSGFMPAVCEYYAKLIGDQKMDQVFSDGGVVLHAISTQKLGVSDWAMIPVAWGTQIMLWVIQAVLFGSVAISYVMIGMLRLIGPLFVPFMIFPRVSFLFWGIIQSLLQYSLFRLAASALVFVVGTAMITFIDNVWHNNYTLANLAVTLPKLAVLTAFSVILAFRLERIVGDIARGASQAGANGIGAAVSAAKTAISATS